MDGAKPHIYEFGEFCLEASTRRLLRGGERVALTPKVFDTLLYLVEHRGTVLTKDELLTALWPDVVVEENNLGQNISKLRSVLGEGPGENRYIATVPGHGYRFVAAVKDITDDGADRLPAALPLTPGPSANAPAPITPVAGVLASGSVSGAVPTDTSGYVRHALAFGLLAGVGLLVFLLWGRSTGAGHHAPVRTVAVLPF